MRARRLLSAILLTLLAGTLAGGCGRGDRQAPLSTGGRIERIQNLIVRGVAHAEVEEWPEAIARFGEAIELAGEDPVLAFNLAVAHFRTGEPEKARAWLDRIGDDTPAGLRARAEYLRGKLALEGGDAQGEAAAYRRAMKLDPSEPAYAYSLSQVVGRLGGLDTEAEVGALLERAHELWPDNARLAAELAQWELDHPDAVVRERGLELLSDLAAGEPRIEELVGHGRSEMAGSPGRSPTSLRRALSLLRPGKRFQTDSSALDARLAVLPRPEPVTDELRRQARPRAIRPTLEVAELLPSGSFAAGETVLDVVAFNDVAEEIPPGSREAHLIFLTDRGLWLLERDVDSYRKLSESRGGRRVLAAELDGDERMEILLLGSGGVELLGRSDDGTWGGRELAPELAAAGTLRSGYLVDFEHDGDLDLLAIDERGRLLLAVHRGEAGLGAPQPAPLPLAQTGASDVRAVLSADLDGDADQDLLIADGESIRVLVNLRQGEFRVAAELPSSGAVQHWSVLDYDGDGRFDLVAVLGERLAFWHNHETRGLVRDEAAERSAANLLAGGADGVPLGAVRSLAVGDVDLDGDSDLLVGYTSDDGPGMAVLAHSADAGLERIAHVEGPEGALAVALDLDGDRDLDPLLLAPEGPIALRNSGAEDQGALRLVLRGLAGKVPLDGRGTRLDVWFGLDRSSVELVRPEAIVGLGGRQPGLVKLTWPNGIIEYVFDPEPGSTQVVEQELRIEGSCPFLYASDGSRLRFVTDILSLAPLGMLAAPDRYVPADPEEYVRLPDWVSADESVELRITEELREVAYIDQSELVVVDAAPGVEIYNGERWIQGRVEGLDLRLLGPLEAPVAVRDARARDVLDLVAELDHRYLAHSDGSRLYQGAATAQHLELEISRELAATGRVSLVLTGWLHWGNTSTNVARAQDPGGAPVFPYVETPTASGGWRRVELDAGLPAGKTKPVVIDLSGVLDPDDPRLRITTDFEVYWDRIAAAETLALDSTPHRVHRLAPDRAALSYEGFSRWYRPAENGPYLFDPADRRPYPWRPTADGERAIAWQEHEGFYTDYGDVTELVRSIDERMAIFGSGEELALSFETASLPDLRSGWSRTLFLHSEGWEKDGDPNVACGQTVGPLPSRAAVGYPCSEAALGDPPLADASSGRWVDRHRLQRRVRGWNPDSFFGEPGRDAVPEAPPAQRR